MLVHPLSPLVALSCATTVVLCVLVAVGRSASPWVDVALDYGWPLMLLVWMTADARRIRRTPCYDFGFLAALCFPLSLPWYCVWSRGWRGVLLLFLLLALWVAPHVLAALFWAFS